MQLYIKMINIVEIKKISREYTIQPGITKIIIDLFAIDDERGCKYVTDRGCKSVQIYKMTFKKPFVEKTKVKINVELRETSMLLSIQNPETRRVEYMSVEFVRDVKIEKKEDEEVKEDD